MRNELWLALGFLTTLPTRTVPYQAGDLGRAARWFPLVGLLLGALLAAAFALGHALSTPPITAVVVVALWAALTGGLHLDGLADCCDGLLASVPRQRRLDIMRDPRLGAFGVIGLVLALLLKAAALLTLPSLGPPDPSPASPWLTLLTLSPSHPLTPSPSHPLTLLLAPTCARWLLLFAARQPSARPGGMGDAFAGSLTTRRLAQASLLPLALLGVATLYDPRSLLAVAGAALATWGVIALARTRIGGVTGDVFGAVVEVSEITILLLVAR